MYELIIKIKDVETPVFTSQDKRLVELARQRHLRSLTEGEIIVREKAEEKN